MDKCFKTTSPSGNMCRGSQCVTKISSFAFLLLQNLKVHLISMKEQIFTWKLELNDIQYVHESV